MNPAFLIPSAPFRFPPSRHPLSHPSFQCNTPPPPRATRLSLPTYRERRYLRENHVERTKGRAGSFARATAFNLSVWPLIVRDLTPTETTRRDRWHLRQLEHSRGAIAPSSDGTEYDYPLVVEEGTAWALSENSVESAIKIGSSRVDFEIPEWAYVVHVSAGRNSLGKRAVQRNRAKRRIRAAASLVFPQHACRGKEYVFMANPEALTIAYPDLLEEVRMALRKVGCWREEMTIDMLRRERYCKR